MGKIFKKPLDKRILGCYNALEIKKGGFAHESKPDIHPVPS